jgi:hypothetical protein
MPQTTGTATVLPFMSAHCGKAIVKLAAHKSFCKTQKLHQTEPKVAYLTGERRAFYQTTEHPDEIVGYTFQQFVSVQTGSGNQTCVEH